MGERKLGKGNQIEGAGRGESISGEKIGQGSTDKMKFRVRLLSLKGVMIFFCSGVINYFLVALKIGFLVKQFSLRQSELNCLCVTGIIIYSFADSYFEAD